jgi:hypothetical protein
VCSLPRGHRSRWSGVYSNLSSGARRHETTPSRAEEEPPSRVLVRPISPPQKNSRRWPGRPTNARPPWAVGAEWRVDGREAWSRCDGPSIRGAVEPRVPMDAAQAAPLSAPCVPGMAQSSRGANPRARCQRSRRRGGEPGRRREGASEGRPVHTCGATHRDRRGGLGHPGRADT